MGKDDGFDRYNRKHRSDSDYSVGESMPGTIGDSDGTLHDRLGDQPIIDEDVVAFEPGSKSREGNRENRNEQESRQTVAPKELSGETTTVELTESVGDGAVGNHKGCRVFVSNASPGETALVNLEERQGTLVGKRVRLKE